MLSRVSPLLWARAEGKRRTMEEWKFNSMLADTIALKTYSSSTKTVEQYDHYPQFLKASSKCPIWLTFPYWRYKNRRHFSHCSMARHVNNTLLGCWSPLFANNYSMMCARYWPTYWIMKEKLDAIAISEGWNTRRAWRTSMKTIPYGNTAHWNMKGRKCIWQ